MTILARITCEIAPGEMSNFVAKPVSASHVNSRAPAQADRPSPMRRIMGA